MLLLFDFLLICVNFFRIHGLDAGFGEQSFLFLLRNVQRIDHVQEFLVFSAPGDVRQLLVLVSEVFRLD